MSREQLVEAYLSGEISRRIFIRRLVAAGVGLAAAVSYSHLLRPDTARAGNPPPDFYDHYGDHYEQPPPPQDQPQPQQQQPPPAQPAGPPPDKTAPTTTMALSGAALATLLRTRSLRVSLGMGEPGTVSVVADIERITKAGASARIRLGTAKATFTAPGRRVVRIKARRRALRALKKARSARVLIKANSVDRAGNVTRRRKRIRLR